jgi:hypothetical protein
VRLLFYQTKYRILAENIKRYEKNTQYDKDLTQIIRIRESNTGFGRFIHDEGINIVDDLKRQKVKRHIVEAVFPDITKSFAGDLVGTDTCGQTVTETDTQQRDRIETYCVISQYIHGKIEKCCLGQIVEKKCGKDIYHTVDMYVYGSAVVFDQPADVHRRDCQKRNLKMQRKTLRL